MPKTINSREQSYTKKGVSPEGDGYPWKPPPFLSSLGKAGEWGGGGGGGGRIHTSSQTTTVGPSHCAKARLVSRLPPATHAYK